MRWDDCSGVEASPTSRQTIAHPKNLFVFHSISAGFDTNPSLLALCIAKLRRAFRHRNLSGVFEMRPVLTVTFFNYLRWSTNEIYWKNLVAFLSMQK